MAVSSCFMKLCCGMLISQLVFATNHSTESNSEPTNLPVQEEEISSHPAAVHQEGGISSNPAAVNIVTGTGAAQAYIEKKLGIEDNYGIRIGGAYLADTNNLFSGGISEAERWTSNSLFLLSLSIDTAKFTGWEGGLFDVEFLNFNGQDTNAQAGSIQGYNSLPGPPPLNRAELYQLWFRQELLAGKLLVRVGKSVPTFDFNNVAKPVALSDTRLFIPAVTGLIYTPIFVNTTLLGVMPGYYNSAYGLTVNIAPIKTWYLSLGAYDGNLARGVQTGLTGPSFNGSYFYIGETGLTWLSGYDKRPGNIGIGIWRQTGPMKSPANLFQQGASGIYLFGTQRLWFRNPGQDISGISAFYQYGKNNSKVLPMTQYVGAGLTAFGLLAERLNDSIGVGVALSWLNQNLFERDKELMFQAYYQAAVTKGIFLQPVISYIPTPGASPDLKAAWTGTLRGIILF